MLKWGTQTRTSYIDRSDREISQLQQQRAGLEASIPKLQGLLQAAQTELITVQGKIRQKQELLREFEIALSSDENKLSDLRRQLSSANDQCYRYKRIALDCRGKIAEAERAIESSEQSIATTNAGGYECDIEFHRTRIQKFTKQLNDNIARLGEAESFQADAEQSRQKIQSEIDALGQRTEELRSSRHTTNIALEELRLKESDLCQRVNELQHQLQSAKSDANSCRDDIQRKEAERVGTERELQNYQQANAARLAEPVPQRTPVASSPAPTATRQLPGTTHHYSAPPRTHNDAGSSSFTPLPVEQLDSAPSADVVNSWANDPDIKFLQQQAESMAIDKSISDAAKRLPGALPRVLQGASAAIDFIERPATTTVTTAITSAASHVARTSTRQLTRRLASVAASSNMWALTTAALEPGELGDGDTGEPVLRQLIASSSTRALERRVRRYQHTPEEPFLAAEAMVALRRRRQEGTTPIQIAPTISSDIDMGKLGIRKLDIKPF